MAKIPIYTISTFNVETDSWEDFPHPVTYGIFKSEEEAIKEVMEAQKDLGEEYDFYINYGEYLKDGDGDNIHGDIEFQEIIERKYDEGGYINTYNQFVTEISKEQLENMIGRKLNGWNDGEIIYGGKKYVKCFLRPYYKIQ